jgi:hypothetical protein
MGRPESPDSTLQHPEHDSDHAQRSHEGEGDKATLHKAHLRRPVPRRTAPARGICRDGSARTRLDQKSFLDR